MNTKSLVELEGAALERADELLDRANHDVAKYMSMTARNIDPNQLDQELAEMIRRDLTRTDGNQAAWTLWSPLSAELAQLSGDKALQEIDRGMSRLAQLVAEWADDESIVAEVVTVAHHTANLITALRRAVRHRFMETCR